MLRLRITKSFKKDYLLMKKRGCDVILLDNNVSQLLKEEKLENRYKGHILKGKYTGLHECHILPDWLLFYTLKAG